MQPKIPPSHSGFRPETHWSPSGGNIFRPVARYRNALKDPAVAVFRAFRSAFGYVSGENPGPQPENAFRFLISVFPFVFATIAWLIASSLSFESQQLLPQPG